MKIWNAEAKQEKIIPADSSAEMAMQLQQKYEVNKLLEGDWIWERTTSLGIDPENS